MPAASGDQKTYRHDDRPNYSKRNPEDEGEPPLPATAGINRNSEIPKTRHRQRDRQQGKPRNLLSDAADHKAEDRSDERKDKGLHQISPARASAASTALRLASEGGVIGRRRVAGKSGRTRFTAYLTGPGEASENKAVWSG